MAKSRGKSPGPLCLEQRRACLSYSGGKCKALTSTEFGGKRCPFYKTKAMVFAQLPKELAEEAMK